MVMRDRESTIGKMADKARLVYVRYIDVDGFPVTKAMLAPRERTGIREFWLTTNTSSNKVACLRRNPKSSLYFVDARFYRGFSLEGTMEVLEDPATKKRIWHAGDTVYYPKGVTDPGYCVLHFVADHGRAYGNFKNEDFTIG